MDFIWRIIWNGCVIRCSNTVSNTFWTRAVVFDHFVKHSFRRRAHRTARQETWRWRNSRRSMATSFRTATLRDLPSTSSEHSMQTATEPLTFASSSVRWAWRRAAVWNRSWSGRSACTIWMATDIFRDRKCLRLSRYGHRFPAMRLSLTCDDWSAVDRWPLCGYTVCYGLVNGLEDFPGVFHFVGPLWVSQPGQLSVLSQ